MVAVRVVLLLLILFQLRWRRLQRWRKNYKKRRSLYPCRWDCQAYKWCMGAPPHYYPTGHWRAFNHEWSVVIVNCEEKEKLEDIIQKNARRLRWRWPTGWWWGWKELPSTICRLGSPIGRDINSSFSYNSLFVFVVVFVFIGKESIIAILALPQP